MVCHKSCAVRVAVGRLSRWSTTWITSLEMTSVAGVSGAVCAICRNQSRRMAVGVRMASRLHMASTVCKQRSSSRQPVLRTLWKSSMSHLHWYHVTHCHASSAVMRVMEVTKIHSSASTPRGWLGLPHPDHGCRKRRHGKRRPVGGRLDGDLGPRDLDQGFPLGASTLGRNGHHPYLIKT